MTEATRSGAPAAAVPERGAAAASLGGDATYRALLDATVARALPVVAHDLRNGLGIVGVQVEALQLRAFAPQADVEAARRHGDAAAAAVERLATQLDALGAWARADEAPLATVAQEAAALVPTRHVACDCAGAPDALLPLPAPLLRVAVLELLLHALDAAGPWTLRVAGDPTRAAALAVVAGRPLAMPAAAEWLVQVERAGATVRPVDGALVLTGPTA